MVGWRILRTVMSVIVLTGLGQTVGVAYSDAEGVSRLRQLAGEQFGVPASLIRLVHQSRELVDSQTVSLPPLSTVAVGLSLLGGVVDPLLCPIAYKTVARLICRKCYCRNGLERTTCRKCGCPDLRNKKKQSKELRRYYKSRLEG